MKKRQKEGAVDPIRQEFDREVGLNAIAELEAARKFRESNPDYKASENTDYGAVAKSIWISHLSRAKALGDERRKRPHILRDMFPKAYHFEFFDVDEQVAEGPPPMEMRGYAVCGDWIPEGAREKEFGVTIYFLKSKDAASAEKLLLDMGWDAWVEGL